MRKPTCLMLMALTVTIVLWGPALGSAAEKKVLIKLSDQVNEQNPHYKAHEFFAKTVAEKSGGSIEVKIFPNSQLGSAREGLEGTLTGTIQAVKVTSGELSTYSPKFLVFSLPYIFTSKKEVFAALAESSETSSRPNFKSKASSSSRSSTPASGASLTASALSKRWPI